MDITVDVVGSFAIVKKILRNPKVFFASIKKEKSWKSAFGLLLVVAALGHILAGLYAIIYSASIGQAIGLEKIIPAILVSYVLTLVMSFVWGWALKIWLAIFKVPSTFSQGYQVMAYTRVPNLILSWLPFVNLFSAIYSFYLLMIGLESVYQIKRRKAVVIIVTSLVAMLVLSTLLFMLFPVV